MTSRMGMPFRAGITIASALALAACATGAPPRPAVVDLPPAFDVTVSELSSEHLDQWWILYNDPQLTALEQRALSQGFSIREAIARLEEARALRGAALSQFGPQGNLQGSAERRQTEVIAGNDQAAGAGSSTTASVTLPVSWELDLFGRRGATRDRANAEIDAAQFDVEAARNAITAEVGRSLFLARGLAAQLQDARQTERIQGELVRVLSVRAERGLAPSTEADRVAGDLAQARAQVADLTAAYHSAVRALLAVVGDATDPLDSVAVGDRLYNPPPVPEIIPGELLQRRPDIRGAEAQVRRSAASVRLAELDFFPRITLNPSAGLSFSGGDLGATSAFWSLGAGLTAPILDRRRLMAQLGAEGARAEQAVLAYERTVQTAFSEADQALIRLAGDRRRVELLDDGVERARRAFEAAEKRYELGFADLQQLLDAERAYRATRSSLTSARIDALQRSVQVFQTLGGGWDANSSIERVS